MKNIFTIAIISTAILFASCQGKDPDFVSQDKIKKELLAVHDEVMPKMGEMNEARKKLIKLIKSEAIKDSTSLEAVNYTIEYLERADEGMMDWMGEFVQPSDMRNSKSHEEIMAYLNEEKEKIIKVKTDILNSLEAANKIIELHENTEQTNK